MTVMTATISTGRAAIACLSGGEIANRFWLKTEVAPELFRTARNLIKGSRQVAHIGAALLPRC
jgi:hypothetical protein